MIKFKLGENIDYSQISILRKVHNDSFHEKTEARNNEQKICLTAREIISILLLPEREIIGTIFTALSDNLV